ncbi:MAG: 5'/3'-nucleotidase SurE [Candidatus Obscuribacterales bacterium]|nr:5'/3'-nucleotidase SurE [Candidatus Obscuribacterales bacterium]
MKILISNDDGIFAKGIRTLALRLSQDSENEVYVVAPDRERSATGHALTLHKPLRVEPAEMEGNLKGSWWTTGTPSDCVKLAVGCLLPEPVDLVVSGINNGANLGGDVLYSGTVSAAREGALLDIPSIAVSVAGHGHRHYEVAAEFVSQMIKDMPPRQPGKKLFLNVNVPNVPMNKIAGVRLSSLGIHAYSEHFEKRVDPRGKVYYWLAGEATEENEEEGTDCWCIHNNLISVTPISFHMTDSLLLKELSGWSGIEKALKGSLVNQARH